MTRFSLLWLLLPALAPACGPEPVSYAAANGLATLGRASARSPARPSIVVFDAAGGVNGRGDVLPIAQMASTLADKIGASLLHADMQPETYLMVDDFATQILGETLSVRIRAPQPSDPLDLGDYRQLEGQLRGVRIVHMRHARLVPQCDLLFELWSGGRFSVHYPHTEKTWLDRYEDLSFVGQQTRIVVVDTFHGESYAEIRLGERSFFISRPGLGSNTLGIMCDLPEWTKVLARPSEPAAKKMEILYEIFSTEKAAAATHARGLAWLHTLLRLKVDSASSRLRSGVIYAHNEYQPFHHENHMGQLRSYVSEVATLGSSDHIDIFVSVDQDPNHLVTCGVDPKLLWTVTGDGTTLQSFANPDHTETLEKLADSGSGLRIVVLDRLPLNIFRATMALADFPIYAEGNSAVSEAISLGKSIVPYVISWNKRFIYDLVHLERELAGTSRPFFDSYFTAALDLRAQFFSGALGITDPSLVIADRANFHGTFSDLAALQQHAFFLQQLTGDLLSNLIHRLDCVAAFIALEELAAPGHEPSPSVQALSAMIRRWTLEPPQKRHFISSDPTLEESFRCQSRLFSGGCPHSQPMRTPLQPRQDAREWLTLEQLG